MIVVALMALGCDSRDKMQTAKELTPAERAQNECLEKVTERYLQARMTLAGKKLEALSRSQPTAALTLAERRLQEEYCAARVRCVSSDALTNSLMFESCLEEPKGEAQEKPEEGTQTEDE